MTIRMNIMTKRVMMDRTPNIKVSYSLQTSVKKTSRLSNV